MSIFGQHIAKFAANADAATTLERLSAGISEIPIRSGSVGLEAEAGVLLKRTGAKGADVAGIVLPTEEVISTIVGLARSSQRVWSSMPLDIRVEMLERVVVWIADRTHIFAAIDCLETGRSISELSKDSLPKAVETMRWFLSNAPDFERPVHEGAQFRVMREPLGVLLAILPWNDPMVLLTWKVFPALLAGNPVIIKPSEFSSGSASLFIEACEACGLPNGVVSLIVGPGDCLGSLLALPDVRGVLFTGSSKSARSVIAAACARVQKPVYAETGGKGAVVVHNSVADPEHVAESIARALFYNQGQICSAPSRIFIDRALGSDFAARVLEIGLEKFAPGDPFLPDTGVGEMISKIAVSNVREVLGGDLAGGVISPILPVELESTALNGKGMRPALFEVLDQQAAAFRLELFAPVGCVRYFDDPVTLMNEVNDTPYGLANGVFCGNDQIELAEKLGRMSESGVWHINQWGEDPPGVPFGGIKDSGIGREKCIQSFEQVTYPKTWMRASQ